MWLVLLACVGPAPVSAAAPARVTVEDDTLVAAAEGLEMRLVTWSVPAARGVAWIPRVPRDGGLDVVPSATVRPLADIVRPLADIVGARPGAWAAIDGGFYEDGPMGLVVSEGVAATPWSKRGGSGIVAYGPDPVRVVHRDAWAAGPREAVQSIDRLVDRGVSLVNERPDARRASRSAVAVSADAVWIVAAVADESVRAAPDGIQLVNTVAYGMTLAEFAVFLVDRGATEALNLDGAVSTQMIVATPTWRWDIRGARGTINAVVIGP